MQQEAHTPTTDKLLNHVATRRNLDALVRRWHAVFWGCAIVYTVLLLISRLLALIPDWFVWPSLLLPPGLAVAIAICLYRKSSRIECARLADQAAGSKDLFLTVAELEKTYGEYRPLVVANSEQTAAKVRPQQIVPYRWGTVARNAVLWMLVLTIGVLFLPQLDPFGRNAVRERAKERKQRLDKMNKAVDQRLAVLKKRPSEKHSKEVAKALEDLKMEFKNMTFKKRKRNVERLRDMQKNLNSLWKKRNQEKMRNMGNRLKSSQSFGAKNKKQREWRQQLRKGDTSGVKKEMDDIKKQAEKLAKAGNSSDKKKQLEDLKKRLKDLNDCLGSEMNSKTMQAALDRAMEQMNMSSMDDATKEALKSLSKSMDLSKRELERLGEMMRDIKSLEQAMKAAQLAKQLNEMEGLKDPSTDGLQGMDDYQKLYDQMKQQAQGGKHKCGSCNGSGKGGDGQPCPDCNGTGQKDGKGGKGLAQKGGAPGGGGGKVDENDSIETDFVSQKSRSKLQAGKILMNWKVRGVNDAGVAKEEYLEQVKQVKQGVSEAVLKEQVPPGYHDAIQQYFDTMEKRASDQKN